MASPAESTEKSASPTPEQHTEDAYKFDGLTGWRRWRVLNPGRGMYHDVRRRLPYYRSDITDAFNYRTVASTIRMYFVKFSDPFKPYQVNNPDSSQPSAGPSIHPGHVPPNGRILRCQ